MSRFLTFSTWLGYTESAEVNYQNPAPMQLSIMQGFVDKFITLIKYNIIFLLHEEDNKRPCEILNIRPYAREISPLGAFAS